MAENTLTPEQQIAELKAQLAAKDEIITGQAEQLQVSEVAASEGRPVVSHNKQHYRVLAPQFDVEGTTIKASELKDKPELIKTLVEKKSGLLQLITKAEAKA